MKVLGFIAAFIAVIVATVIVLGQLGLLHGRQPQNLGVKEGRLKPPSRTENSVSSQASLYPDHPQLKYASIEPFPTQGNGQAAIQKLARILAEMPGTVVVKQETDYIYAQSTTKLLKFTDDVEFWLDPVANVIHVRSSSRLGGRDFAVNRKRVETIRAQFLQN